MPFPQGVKHTKDADSPMPLTRSFLMSGIWRLGSGRTTVQQAALISAHVDVCRTCLAIESYRAANAALPGSLVDLGTKFLKDQPTDPFDGQPLRYKKLAKGYVVYSVGEDGKDDGGDEKKDITFTVER